MSKEESYDTNSEEELSLTTTESETENTQQDDEQEVPQVKATSKAPAKKAGAKATATKTATATRTKKAVVEKAAIDVDEKVEVAIDGDEIYVAEPLTELTAFGANAGDIKKLEEGGVCTVQALRMNTKKFLCNIKGMSEGKIEKILAASAEFTKKKALEKTAAKGVSVDEKTMKLIQAGLATGTEIQEKRKGINHITTGAKAFDDALGGGIESQAITEVYGAFRSGKSQLCHTVAVAAQLPKTKGGASGPNGSCKVLFIDTEGTFRPERIQSIATRFGIPAKQALDNIIVASVKTHEAQMAVLSEIPSIMAKDKFGLIIVDSIIALFKTDFTGRGELAERQQRLNQHLSMLSKLAVEHNLAVLITNQVMACPDGTIAFGDPNKPVGGNILAHASTVRISIKKAKGDTRKITVVDSPTMPESDALFAISSGGIVDAME